MAHEFTVEFEEQDGGPEPQLRERLGVVAAHRLAKLEGAVVYRESRFPLTWPLAGEEAPPKFLGYRVAKDGLPTFRYQRGGITWAETIRPLSDGTGIERHFELDTGKSMAVVAENAVVTSSTGTTNIPASAKSFTLTLRWK